MSTGGGQLLWTELSAASPSRGRAEWSDSHEPGNSEPAADRVQGWVPGRAGLVCAVQPPAQRFKGNHSAPAREVRPTPVVPDAAMLD